VLNPAFAAAMTGGSACRNFIYSLIWQSVMWRPGKGRFLIGVKNLPPTRPAAIASGCTPPGRRRSPGPQRQSGYALLPSRTWRHFLILIDVPLSPCLPRRSYRAALDAWVRVHPDQVRTYAARQALEVVLGARGQMRV
jgi:hypothetical protein